MNQSWTTAHDPKINVKQTLRTVSFRFGNDEVRTGNLVVGVYLRVTFTSKSPGQGWTT